MTASATRMIRRLRCEPKEECNAEYSDSSCPGETIVVGGSMSYTEDEDFPGHGLTSLFGYNVQQKGR